jgi:PPOX class probable F420-dependent enzyme
MERATLDLSNPKDAHMDERLRTEPVIWLCTVRPDERPHLVPVWFTWDGEAVIIFSQPGNQKLRNIEQNPNVVLALDTRDQGFDVVEIEGRAELLNDPNVTPEMPAYASKYRELASRRMGVSMDIYAQSVSQAIRVTPTRFRTAY